MKQLFLQNKIFDFPTFIDVKSYILVYILHDFYCFQAVLTRLDYASLMMRTTTNMATHATITAAMINFHFMFSHQYLRLILSALSSNCSAPSFKFSALSSNSPNFWSRSRTLSTFTFITSTIFHVKWQHSLTYIFYMHFKFLHRVCENSCQLHVTYFHAKPKPIYQNLLQKLTF